MPGKDFEKQVQQKMDELHFVPSDAVWQKVEKQISGRQKRRVLLWMPFLILLLGGAAWLFYPGAGTGNKKKQPADYKSAPVTIESGKNENVVATKKQTAKEIKQTDTDAAGAAKKNIAGKNDLLPADKNNKTKPAVAVKEDNLITTIAGVHPATGMSINIDQNDRKKNTTSVKQYAQDAGYVSNGAHPLRPGRTKRAAKVQAEKPLAADEEVITANNTEPKKENSKTGQVITEENRPVAAALVAGIINAVDAPVIAKAAVTDSIINAKNDTAGVNAVAKNRPPKTKTKIEWGISLDAGVSKISQGLTGLFTVTPSYDASAFSSPQNNTNPGGINNNFTGPSDVKPGFAYAAGIFISKQLDKTSRVMAGLHYSYNSTHIELGAKIDSSSGTIQYHTGHSANYINRFHFIELPVMIEKQLGKASRFSVNGGVAFSLLAGSNALQYDAQKNIYYSDNSSINKTQWALLAGFNYRWLQKTVQLETGPQFNYNLTNIFKKELYGSRHLLFAGISTKIYFRKNKR